MSEYFEHQSNAKAHHGDIELDGRIIDKLPQGAVVKSCRGHGISNWNRTAHLDFVLDGQLHSYFLKILTGPKGRPMVHGEYESMRLIHESVPKFSPMPLAWGPCADPTKHFILFTFHELSEGLPPIPQFVNAVAQLHTVKRNPSGKFGFHVTTYNGTLAQDNTWCDTWEEFYMKGMKRILKLEEEVRGPSSELRKISVPFLSKVIPRLLRPLETQGRKIDPVLIHGDLWIGNVSAQAGSNDPLMFDASAFWGHNEYELSTMRPLKNEWAKECMESYHALIPRSEPVEDWDARNALYAIRTYAHDSALYPDEPKFREKLMEEMQNLVAQFAEGHNEARG
ncbi:unnamed protein product [Clonostachys rosea]|uniref:protein-ribulosamine 3-kinase n=1 Tax=Bionectria ochroleuca TaxID=29856 RepID=A0ABY6U6A2_BIOOC|nr:unnamed protein product [Clonostachys rosea]